mmetsp:Transcript_116874/g.342240  ORF Transcript_116874/g.342240 Transcript_116874/m.342240 type:complete len:234 (+) Transcript_116874:16-717(+)
MTSRTACSRCVLQSIDDAAAWHSVSFCQVHACQGKLLNWEKCQPAVRHDCNRISKAPEVVRKTELVGIIAVLVLRWPGLRYNRAPATGPALSKALGAKEKHAALSRHIKGDAVGTVFAAALVRPDAREVTWAHPPAAVAPVIGVEQHLPLAVVGRAERVAPVLAVAQVDDGQDRPLAPPVPHKGQDAGTGVVLDPLETRSPADAAEAAKVLQIVRGVIPSVQGRVVEVDAHEV